MTTNEMRECDNCKGIFDFDLGTQFNCDIISYYTRCPNCDHKSKEDRA